VLLAVIVQVPSATKVTSLPRIVQTEVVADVSVTPSPFEGEADAAGNVYAFSEPDQLNIDLLAAPGRSATRVIENMIIVCEQYRQDCLAIIDPPSNFSPKEIIQWQNGVHPLNNRKLDSDFAALYWPWVAIRDGYNGLNVFAST